MTITHTLGEELTTHDTMEHRVHAYLIEVGETVCGISNPEATATMDPDKITCTYCRTALARTVIDSTLADERLVSRETIHMACPDGGIVCGEHDAQLSLFWDDVTCASCKATAHTESHSMPFTVNELFKAKVQERWFSRPCLECGAIVSNRRIETHAAWHNKVADL
jgi:hypothetical protein